MSSPYLGHLAIPRVMIRYLCRKVDTTKTSLVKMYLVPIVCIGYQQTTLLSKELKCNHVFGMFNVRLSSGDVHTRREAEGYSKCFNIN